MQVFLVNEGRSKSFASRYVKLKKTFQKMYNNKADVFFSNSCELEADVTSLNSPMMS